VCVCVCGCDSVFTYDGLWDVVDWWGERPRTDFNSGFLVYRYRLRRRPGQDRTSILSKVGYDCRAAHERVTASCATT
jgi:hypothetical protein